MSPQYSNATYVFLKHTFHEIRAIKQLFSFFLGKYDHGKAPREKQYSPIPKGAKQLYIFTSVKVNNYTLFLNASR